MNYNKLLSKHILSKDEVRTMLRTIVEKAFMTPEQLQQLIFEEGVMHDTERERALQEEEECCEMCGKPTEGFTLNMCEDCFDDETDKQYEDD